MVGRGSLGAAAGQIRQGGNAAAPSGLTGAPASRAAVQPAGLSAAPGPLPSPPFLHAHVWCRRGEWHSRAGRMKRTGGMWARHALRTRGATASFALPMAACPPLSPAPPTAGDANSFCDTPSAPHVPRRAFTYLLAAEGSTAPHATQWASQRAATAGHGRERPAAGRGGGRPAAATPGPPAAPLRSTSILILIVTLIVQPQRSIYRARQLRQTDRHLDCEPEPPPPLCMVSRHVAGSAVPAGGAQPCCSGWGRLAPAAAGQRTAAAGAPAAR